MGNSNPPPPSNPYPAGPTTSVSSTYLYFPGPGNPIRMSDLRYVLAGYNPVSMSDYRATSNQGFSKGISGITDTNLSLSKFYGKSSPVYYIYDSFQYIEYTQASNAISFNWTAPMDCCIDTVEFYVGSGNNGTHVSMWTSAGTTFISGFYPVQPYALMTIAITSVQYGPNKWNPDSVFLTKLGGTRVTAGTVVTVYISSLSTSNYLYYGRNGNTNAPSFRITYVPYR
jgi:hypothetical protein